MLSVFYIIDIILPIPCNNVTYSVFQYNILVFKRKYLLKRHIFLVLKDGNFNIFNKYTLNGETNGKEGYKIKSSHYFKF